MKSVARMAVKVSWRVCSTSGRRGCLDKRPRHGVMVVVLVRLRAWLLADDGRKRCGAVRVVSGERRGSRMARIVWAGGMGRDSAAGVMCS